MQIMEKFLRFHINVLILFHRIKYLEFKIKLLKIKLFLSYKIDGISFNIYRSKFENSNYFFN